MIERALAGAGPLTREELRERVRAANVPTEGQAFVHVVMQASLQGVVVRGPMIGRRHAFVLVGDWLGDQRPPVERGRALAELARRYLAGHGPADERDLARWAGVPLRDARAGLAAIASELDHREGGLVALRGTAAAELPPPLLLGAFEPVLLGWSSRAPILGAAEAAVVSGGIFRPFALVRGAAAATWRLDDGRVTLSPFGQLSRSDARALEKDAAAVERFLAS